MPSNTTIRGRHCLRVAMRNHRTRDEDRDLLANEVLRISGELTGKQTLDKLGTPRLYKG